MADYGGRGGGDSLRDALNQLYPMTGLGEYGAGFPPRGMLAPPASGDPTPSPPVPLPPQRPAGAPGPGYAPLPNPAIGGPPPRLALPQGIQPNAPIPIGAPPGGMPGAPGGGMALPIRPGLNAFAGAGRPYPGGYAAQLGLAGQY